MHGQEGPTRLQMPIQQRLPAGRQRSAHRVRQLGLASEDAIKHLLLVG
jgi:hypothetical protein